MRRLAVVVCALALLSLGCAEQQLGRRILDCGTSTETIETSITTTLLLTAQAVPGADFIPCVNTLQPGWNFQHVQARSGQAFFTIDSDRMGTEFLRVTLLPSCDVGTAREVNSNEPGTTLSIQVLEDRLHYEIVVIPVAERHLDYAIAVTVLIAGDIVKGRRLVATVDASDKPISEKVTAAHAAGSPVIIIDDAEMDTVTFSMRRVGEDEESGLTYDATLEEISDDVDEPLYRARWFYTFPGGCIRYDIDAEGEGAQLVSLHVAQAIGMYPMEAIRKIARDAGYGGFE